MTHMPYHRFLGFELIAALFWTGGYCLLGYFLGAQFVMLQSVIERWGFVLAGALVLAYLGWPLVRSPAWAADAFRAQALAATELIMRALLAGCQFTREVVGADAQPVVEVETVGCSRSRITAESRCN